MLDSRKEFLGSGLSFPLTTNSRGELALVTGAEDINQAIQIILGTMPGERVMRPEFGCRAWELIFAPNDAATRTLLAYYVERALAMWEPRIEITKVDVRSTPSSDGALFVVIDYVIKDTYDPRTIVYPFFLMGQE